MVMKLYPEQDVQDIADAIRGKNGLSDTYKIGQMASAITAIPTGGGGGDYEELVMRTISEASGSMSFIGGYAFRECDSLTVVDFPNVEVISQYAFASCSNLTTVSFPNASYISNYAFANCANLPTASFPNASYVGGYAFASCPNLTAVSIPNATEIAANAFANCVNLSTVSFPNATQIGSSAFRSCYNLLSLYLLGSSVATLANATAFSSTPISTYTTSTGGVNGSIFVPASLFSNYRTAANWSAYYARFVSV